MPKIIKYSYKPCGIHIYSEEEKKHLFFNITIYCLIKSDILIT